jgi:protein-S-isoprenylcysteine O-methyltransferase Ste14
MNSDTITKISSFISYLLAVVGLVFLILTKHLFSAHPAVIIIQVLSAGLMVWARITFGARSFHAIANTTKGKLVTNGPYHLLRHPIYASVIYFTWAGVSSYLSLEVAAAALLVTVSLFIRMLLEERFLKLAYDEYGSYSERTYRIIPFLF